MPLLRRRQLVSYAPDPALGDPVTIRCRAALQRGAWPEVRDAVQTATSWDDREFYVTVLAEVPGWPRWLDDWAVTEPDSALTWTMRGAHGIHWAWEARGHARASAVARDAMSTFHRRLAQVEADLAQATRLDPSDPTPWVCSLMSGRGLSVGRDELWGRFCEAVARNPQSRYGHHHMLLGLTAKWGGSHELMFDFARTASASAPDGSGLHTLIAEAHIERWLFFHMEGDGDGAARYWTRLDVQADLFHAAERSVFSPHIHLGRRTAWDRNIFAFCFWKAGHRDAARSLFQQIGAVNSDHPWYYGGEATAVFTQARNECM